MNNKEDLAAGTSVVVIGLGTFGSRIARKLYQGGADVLAIDQDEAVIDVIGDEVSQAVCASATDEEALLACGSFDADIAIVAVRQHFDVSVLATHLLAKHGVGRILVQVDSGQEAEAITAVGATQTIFPQRDMAERIAQRLLVPDLADYIPLGDNVAIVDIPCPSEYVGKSLIDLDLRRQHDITVIALRMPGKTSRDPETVEIPAPAHLPLEEGWVLVLAGKSDSLTTFRKNSKA